MCRLGGMLNCSFVPKDVHLRCNAKLFLQCPKMVKVRWNAIIVPSCPKICRLGGMTKLFLRAQRCSSLGAMLNCSFMSKNV